jgi:predicted  nucleic acid-binding Zn-ribbon protein
LLTIDIEKLNRVSSEFDTQLELLQQEVDELYGKKAVLESQMKNVDSKITEKINEMSAIQLSKLDLANAVDWLKEHAEPGVAAATGTGESE